MAPVTPLLAPPFAQLFTDWEEAVWAFAFIRESLHHLGVPGPYDPRVAVSLARRQGHPHLRIYLGHAEVLALHSPHSRGHGLDLPFLAGDLPLDPELPHWPFDRAEDEPKVFIYKLPTAAARHMTPALASVYEQTLGYIAERLTDWAPSPYRRQHQPALCEAFFDDEKRAALLTLGLKALPNRRGAAVPHYWKVSPGTNGALWPLCRDGGYIAINWSDFGDLTKTNRTQFDALQAELLERHPTWTQAGTQQVWKFAKHIRPGDRIVANRGTTEILGVGTVTGPYYYEAQATHPHRFPVRWDDLSPRSIDEYGWRRTLVQLNREKFERLIQDTNAPAVADPPVPYAPGADHVAEEAVYTPAHAAKDTGYEVQALTRWLAVLQRKKQVILYGPPGTGKTYLAQHLARLGISGTDGITETVQFHPAYSYEAFIEGIRPTHLPDGRLAYPLVPGRFLTFCRQAATRSGPCVLIIDEINRANLAQVFGELMYLLEYRTETIALAEGTPFSIPENVWLIGTMNTADRSLALVDHAMRRRFAFIPLAPNYELLRHYHAGTGFDVEGLVQLLQRLNAQIGNPHYAVGVSFFLVPDVERHLQDIWQLEIEPYLAAYFFDQPEQANLFSWSAVAQEITRPRT